MPRQAPLRGSRRELALVFADGPRTAHEAGKALGKQTGSFFGVLRRMHAEGLLVADTETPTRGTQYTLAPEVQAALTVHSDGAAAIGVVAPRQQLLLVDQPSDPIAAQRVLARHSIAGSVAWAAEVGGGWLLAIADDVSDAYQLQRLEMALAHAGMQCRQVHVTGVVAGAELRERASWLLDELKGGRVNAAIESRE